MIHLPHQHDATVGTERAYAINQSTTFIPSVRADYIKVHNDGYNEKGAGVLNLDVGSSKAESLVLARIFHETAADVETGMRNG